MADFSIHEHTPEAKPGHYDDEVKALLDAIETQGNDNLAIDILVKEGDEAKHKRYFQVSAKNFDRTGRAVNETPQGDGSTLIEFVLAPRVKRERKPKTETSEDTPTAA